MTLPNFRLFETQARWSVYVAVAAAAGLAALSYCVFKGFHLESRTIPFDANSAGLGRFRAPLVLGFTAVVALLGIIGFGLGYSSLGERRNDRQSWSWSGMLLGAGMTTLAVLELIAWRTLSFQIIR